ncbi:nucleoside hydrolase, partial [Rhizobium leguminosarum]|uniref:nucleoside hydrolase n=1 Tax=Rhizobium leguminosarum TaxID=384 RepID=UPI003F9D6938
AGCAMHVLCGHQRSGHRPIAAGMDGADLPEPSMPMQEQHGVDFIIETLQSEPAGAVTVCTLGPLTNFGKALTRAPEIAGR